MSMNFKIILIMGLFCLCGCDKSRYEFIACFNTEKENYLVGEEIMFENCSTQKGNKEGVPYGVLWIMGDGKVINSFNNEPITHTYHQPGEYLVKLRVGLKDKGPADEIEKTITIIE